MGSSINSAYAKASQGNPRALYELGIAYSTGARGVVMDLIEAHKWFNLAAMNGSREAQACRAEVAREMDAREIAEAQRQARAWLSGGAVGLAA